MTLFRFAVVLILSSIILLSCDSKDTNDDITTEFGNLFVTSNTTPVIGIFDFSGDSSTNFVQFGIASSDADGVIYDDDNERLIIASRSNNRLEVYTDLEKTELSANLILNYSSNQDFSNARKLAKSANKVLVVQDANAGNNNENKFFVYQLNNSSASLINTYEIRANLWDAQFAGNKLYAVHDNSDTLAVYNNVLDNNDGVVTADLKVQIEGIVRTHAFYYVHQEDLMLLTDIGDADSGTDGAIHIISDFSIKLGLAGNNGAISLDDQIVIAGNNTELGNPVGITYDAENEKIYVAERKSEGGKVLQFDLPTVNGNQAPTFSQNFAGAAAVYFSNRN